MGATYSQAWLTPDRLPDTFLCRALFIPNDPDIFACVLGAIVLLCDESSWEPFGIVTPEEIASAMSEMREKFVGGESCMPTGSCIDYAGSDVPDGWLYCDGSLYLVEDYPSLAAVLGDRYGGDGVLDFAVPDLRGRVSVGEGQQPGFEDYALGATGGVEKHILSRAEMPSHKHVVDEHLHGFTDFPYLLTSVTPGAVPIGYSGSPYQSATQTASPSTDAKGGGQPHENRQPYLVAKRIIKT